MTIIGVTGGVGTGKSTVARMFGIRLKGPVLDADRIAHRLMRPHSPVWRRIRARFGKGVIASSGEIDRRRLGRITFGDPKKLETLCKIIHPAVRRWIQGEIRKIRRSHDSEITSGAASSSRSHDSEITSGAASSSRSQPRARVILDVPLLIEAGSAYPLDFLVVVSAPLKVVARRLKKRSGWTLREVKRRQGFQMPLREKERLADFVVDNGGTLEAARRQVSRICFNVSRKTIREKS